MKKIALLLGFMTLATSAQAATFTVPSKDILAAARTLVSQNGPVYSVKGTIQCISVFTGRGSPTSQCEINIKGSKAVVESPEKIISAVSKKSGSYYSFTGSFTATSVSSELPPYGAKETVKITLK